ncbi:MAG: hypothetical protein PW734_12590 [Verrucomicrobium sp.]|nr:hypothetical protein [Verrucomicrobium sp.]
MATDWTFDVERARHAARLIDRHEVEIAQLPPGQPRIAPVLAADPGRKPEAGFHLSRVFPKNLHFDAPLKAGQQALSPVEGYEAQIVSSRVKVFYREFSDEDQSYKSPQDVLIQNNYLGRQTPDGPLHRIEESMAFSFGQFLAVYPPAKELAVEHGLELPHSFIDFEPWIAMLEKRAERNASLASVAGEMKGSKGQPSTDTPGQDRDAAR